MASQRQVRSHPLNTENLLYTPHHVIRSVRLHEKPFYKVQDFSVQCFDYLPKLIKCWDCSKLLVAAFNSLKNIPRSLSLSKWITDPSGWHLLVSNSMEFYFSDSEIAWGVPFPNNPSVFLENLRAVPQKACLKREDHNRRSQEIIPWGLYIRPGCFCIVQALLLQSHTWLFSELWLRETAETMLYCWVKAS